MPLALRQHDIEECTSLAMNLNHYIFVGVNLTVEIGPMRLWFLLIIGIFVSDIADERIFGFIPAFEVLSSQCHKLWTRHTFHSLYVVLGNVPGTPIFNSTNCQSGDFTGRGKPYFTW